MGIGPERPAKFFAKGEVYARRLRRSLQVGSYSLTYEERRDELVLTTSEGDTLLSFVCDYPTARAFAKDFGFDQQEDGCTRWSIELPEFKIYHERGEKIGKHGDRLKRALDASRLPYRIVGREGLGIGLMMTIGRTESIYNMASGYAISQLLEMIKQEAERHAREIAAFAP